MTVVTEISSDQQTTQYEYLNEHKKLEKGVSCTQYMQLTYEEFLEMLARVAERKFGTHFKDGPPQGDSFTFEQKVEMLLDLMIQYLFNCKAVLSAPMGALSEYSSSEDESC